MSIATTITVGCIVGLIIMIAIYRWHKRRTTP